VTKTSEGGKGGWKLTQKKEPKERRGILYPLPLFSPKDRSLIYQSIAMQILKCAKIRKKKKGKKKAWRILESYFKDVCPLIDLLSKTIALIGLDKTEPHNQIILA